MTTLIIKNAKRALWHKPVSKVQFSLIALLLAFGYWIYQFTQNDFDAFGIHFRFLTHWGLTLALLMHFLLFYTRFTGRGERHFALISVVAVINMLVLVVYWVLFIMDPALVNDDEPSAWYQEYYVHLVGPLIVVADALFINRAFRQFWRGGALTLIMCGIYIAWIEFAVRPVNTEPVGTFTAGLPYPFLNDMSVVERITFYATMVGAAVLCYILFWLIPRIPNLRPSKIKRIRQ